MGSRILAIVFAISILNGCSSLDSQREEWLERGSNPPASDATLMRRIVGENGVLCQYSDGVVVRRQNVATPCL